MTALDLAAEGEEPSLQMNGMIEMPSKVEWNFISLFFFFFSFIALLESCVFKSAQLYLLKRSTGIKLNLSSLMHQVILLLLIRFLKPCYKESSCSKDTTWILKGTHNVWFCLQQFSQVHWGLLKQPYVNSRNLLLSGQCYTRNPCGM